MASLTLSAKSDWPYEMQCRLRTALATLRLAAYATDAMRVLDVLQQHADLSAPFDRTIASACRDWRNPGAVHPPADLLTEVLARIAEDVQDVVHELAEQAAREGRA